MKAPTTPAVRDKNVTIRIKLSIEMPGVNEDVEYGAGRNGRRI